MLTQNQIDRIDVGDCWLWVGYVREEGYGQCLAGMAHRVIYKALVGEIADGLQLDHLCRVRNCVNPDHLEPVTPKENNTRSRSIQSLNGKKTHCKWGHKFSGGRSCRTCTNRLQREYQARKRAARLASEGTS